jgi:hypothetical protein
VKLGKNSGDTWALISEAFGGETMKKSSVFEWHTEPKKVHMLKSQMKAMFATFFNISQVQTVNQAYVCGNTEAVT